MNKKTKILFLLHLPPPYHGSSVVGLNIKKDVAINKSFDCFFVNLLASNNVTETGKINTRKIFGFVKTFFQVGKFLISKRPNLCYFALTVTGAALYKDLVLVALLKIFSVKRIYHLHNKGVRAKKDRSVHRLIYNFIFKDSDVIILSKYLYSDIEDFVPESKLHVCPNGVEDEAGGAPEDKALIKTSPELPIVNLLFLSNLIEAKGVYVLLEALALLRRRNISFRCSFIGSEGDIGTSQFNDQKARLGLEGFAKYEGKKFGIEKKQAFLLADVFVFPTYYSNECFPLVLLEAMSYSLPVISTPEGGIRDIVEEGHTGFLVAQQNVEQLAVSIERLIVSPSMRLQMGTRSRNTYEQKFSREIFEHRLLNILGEVSANVN